MSDAVCIRCRKELPPERLQHRAHADCVTRLPLEAMTPAQKRSAREINNYVVRTARHQTRRRRAGDAPRRRELES